MRTALLTLLLLATVNVLADDGFTVFISDPGYQRSHSTTSTNVGDVGIPVNHTTSELSGGIGLAYSHAWNARWSTEAAVTFERHHALATKLIPYTSSDGTISTLPATERAEINTFPIDVVTRYHFTNSTRWTPFAGFGIHYVAAPDTLTQGTVAPNQSGFVPVVLQRYDNRSSAQIDLGTTLRLSRRADLLLDVKRQLRSDSVPFDPLTRASVGVKFRF